MSRVHRTQSRLVAASPRGRIVVLGEADSDDPLTSALQTLGAAFHRTSLWMDAAAGTDAMSRGDLLSNGEHPLAAGATPRLFIFDTKDRPDLAARALSSLKQNADWASIPTLLTIPERQVAILPPSHAFDDFLVAPFFATELYARIRKLEWRASEFLTEEHLKLGALTIDRAQHEVSVAGAPVALTAREYKLLAFFVSHLRKAFTREQLLARVWGPRYEGGAKTVDIHIRRLRMKLGAGFPLETRRGLGYILPAPTAKL